MHTFIVLCSIFNCNKFLSRLNRGIMSQLMCMNLSISEVIVIFQLQSVESGDASIGCSQVFRGIVISVLPRFSKGQGAI